MELHFLPWLVMVLVLTTDLAKAKPTNGIEVIDRRESRIPGSSSKTRYYVCPPEFIRLGNKCYLLSHSIGTWQDAHFDCQDRKAELATIEKAWEDRHLRKYLHKPELARLERWIGGIYDWQQMKWTWGVSGRRMEYNGFYRLKNNTSDDLKWQCAIIDPQLKYKWSYRSCVDRKHYICQTDLQKMTKKQQNKYEKHFSQNGVNARLNQIPIPDQFSDSESTSMRKPKPQRVRPSNQHNFKIHQPRVHPNYRNWPSNIQVGRDDNEIAQFAHRNRSNDLTVRRKTGRQQRIRNRCRNRDIYVNRQVDPRVSEDECVRILNENWRKKNRMRKQRRNKENIVQSSPTSLESITPKTYVFYPRISELHPHAITEVHDF